MWSAYLNLKTCHRRPSEDLEESDTIAAWCVDNTVLWFGTTIENALLERVNRGTQKDPKMEPRYTLSELLDPLFRLFKPLPAPRKAQGQGNSGLAALLAMARTGARSGVKRYEYKPN